MYIAYVIAAVLLSLLLAFSARNLLVRDPGVAATMTRVGVPDALFPLLAAPKIAGALGLLIGTLFLPLGLAAGIGVALFFLGAAAAHLRVKDAKGAAVPVVIAVVAALTSTLAAASI